MTTYPPAAGQAKLAGRGAVGDLGPELIIRLAAGFMAAKHLFAASEFGLFEALADAPAGLDALAARTGLTRRAARISADAMVALGLLETDGGIYRNSAVAAAFLAGPGPGDLRPFLRFCDEISYPAWARLADVLATGSPQEIFEFSPELPGVADTGGGTTGVLRYGPPSCNDYGVLVGKPLELPFDPIDRAARIWEARFGPSPSMAAVTSIMRAQQILLGELDALLRPYELTFARYEALVLLTFSRRGALPLRVIGERLMVHPTSVTNIISRLERQAMVVRRPNPEDGRGRLAEITEQGRAVVEQATRDLMAAEFGLAGYGTGQLKELFDLLRKLRLTAGDFIPQDAADTRGAADADPDNPDTPGS